MIFLTVGTQFPFDRLIKAIDDIANDGLINEEIFGQIGESLYQPRNFESAVALEKEIFDNYVKNAEAIIGHAGMGTITMALSNHKPLLVMPRLKKYREVVNDHQLAIAEKFAGDGHLLLSRDESELAEGIKRLRSFVPRQRKAEPQAVAERIKSFLSSMGKTRKLD